MAPEPAGSGAAGAAAVKIVWVMVDGLGDVDVSAADTGREEGGGGGGGGKGDGGNGGGGGGRATPLALARTPALDALARAGLNGLMDPVEPGLACGSDTAHLSMLSYAPSAYYVGRGAFESLGAVRCALRASRSLARVRAPALSRARMQQCPTRSRRQRGGAR